jgi:tetratricopeptide (TPR) repeat protein
MRYTLLVILMMLTLSSFAQEAKIEDIAPSEYYLEGVRCYNLGQFSEARELLSRAIGGNQENDAAYYYLALSYLELQDTQAAEAYLLKAQEKDPANFWYKVKLAQFYTATGDNRKAISIYEEIARDYPAKRSIYYDIIDLYAADQQYDKALETINKIESLKGENEMTGEVKYELMIRKGDYHGAMAHLEEYYTKYPSPRVALVLGDLNKSLYRDSSAIRYYQEALSLEPDYAPAFFGLAEVYRSKMKYSEYFPYIIRFMESPEMKVDFKTRYMKEVVMNPHFVRQYMNEVDAMANSLVNAHPQDTASLYTIGAYYIQTGRDTLGKLLFKGAVESHPNDERANREYISLLYYMKEWEELAEQCERALFHFPKDLSIMEIRPVAYWQSGDSDKAISLYNELISNLPKRDTTAYLYYASLGDIYHEKGDLKKAYSHYEKALRINPDYNPSLNNYAYYMCLEGKNLKKAAKMSLKTITSEPDNPTYLDTYAWILYRMGEFSEAKTHIKRAMFYGGNEDATLLDHYAEILYALKEYDLAFIYWEQADKKDPSLGIGEKIKERKLQMKR